MIYNKNLYFYVFKAFMNKINLVKPVIRLYRPDDTRKLCSFEVLENKAGNLFINTKKFTHDNNFRFIIELKNKLGHLLGFEHYSHFEGTESMTGLYINVNEEYRQRNYYLGEILRLASIIQMLENKVKNFSIKSKSTAVYFHAKYKFQPSVTAFHDRDKLLKTIADDKSPDFKDLSQRAKIFTEQIKNILSGEKQRSMCRPANELIKEYITRALSEKNIKQHQFGWTMDMTLTEETIKGNKDFFNALFSKHGIDYKI